MPFLTYWPISRGYGRVVVRVALRWSTGCHGPPHVASRIAVFIWLTSGSALIAYVAHARSTAAGEDRQVQLGEASGVGDELDGDDPAAGQGEAECPGRLPAGGPDCTGSSIDQCQPGAACPSAELPRDRCRAVEVCRGTRLPGRPVGPEYDIGIQ